MNVVNVVAWFDCSPSGKLVQIEYALAAVASGAPSVGIKAMNGVVLATEKKQKSIIAEEHSIFKVEQVADHIGMIYSGMGPDYRLLVKRARKIAQQYFLIYNEPIPTTQLVQRVAQIMQEYTQSGGVRPFGVSLLIAGWDNERPYLFQCDPSVRLVGLLDLNCLYYVFIFRGHSLLGKQLRWARITSMASRSSRRGKPVYECFSSSKLTSSCCDHIDTAKISNWRMPSRRPS